MNGENLGARGGKLREFNYFSKIKIKFKILT